MDPGRRVATVGVVVVVTVVVCRRVVGNSWRHVVGTALRGVAWADTDGLRDPADDLLVPAGVVAQINPFDVHIGPVSCAPDCRQLNEAPACRHNADGRFCGGPSTSE